MHENRFSIRSNYVINTNVRRFSFVSGLLENTTCVSDRNFKGDMIAALNIKLAGIVLFFSIFFICSKLI